MKTCDTCEQSLAHVMYHERNGTIECAECFVRRLGSAEQVQCCKPPEEHCCHRVDGNICGWHPQGYGYCAEQERTHKLADAAMAQMDKYRKKLEGKK